MREKFEKIPPPLQKQIIMRCGAALVSLLLMVVSLLLEGNLYLSLSVLLFFAFYGFSALQLLYRAVTDQIVVIRGHCTRLEKTPMRRRITAVPPRRISAASSRSTGAREYCSLRPLSGRTNRTSSESMVIPLWTSQI